MPLFNTGSPSGSRPILFTQSDPSVGMNFDIGSRIFSTSEPLHGSFILADVPRVDDASGSMFLSAFIDLDGTVSTGAFSVIGMIPSLGITTDSLLLSGTVSAVDIVMSEDKGSDADLFTQAIIELNFSMPALGFGQCAGFQHLTPDLPPGVSREAFVANVFAQSFSLGTTSDGDIFALTIPEPPKLAL